MNHRYKSVFIIILHVLLRSQAVQRVELGRGLIVLAVLCANLGRAGH